MKQAIEINNLQKSYKNFNLGPINLNLPSGYIIGLIGENGAGKTTLIKSLLSIIHQDQGTVKIFNKNSQTQEELIKEDIGVVLEEIFFPDILTPKNINSIMKSTYKNWDTTFYYKLLEDFNIESNKDIKILSKGTKKKLEIAVALSHHPKLLILDEPTSGLDPIIRSEILDLFLKFIKDENHTILLSTHITSDLEHIADQIVFINDGKIILNEIRDELIDNYGILKCSQEEFSKIAKQDIIAYKKNKYNYEILITNKNQLRKKYKEFIIDKITLEDLMVLLIKGEK